MEKAISPRLTNRRVARSAITSTNLPLIRPASGAHTPMPLLSLVFGSPASGLDCSMVPSEWKTNMWYGNGASGAFTSHVPTTGDASILRAGTGRHAGEQRHRTAAPRAVKRMRISTENSLRRGAAKGRDLPIGAGGLSEVYREGRGLVNGRRRTGGLISSARSKRASPRRDFRSVSFSRPSR